MDEATSRAVATFHLMVAYNRLSMHYINAALTEDQIYSILNPLSAMARSGNMDDLSEVAYAMLEHYIRDDLKGKGGMA